MDQSSLLNRPSPRLKNDGTIHFILMSIVWIQGYLSLMKKTGSALNHLKKMILNRIAHEQESLSKDISVGAEPNYMAYGYVCRQSGNNMRVIQDNLKIYDGYDSLYRKISFDLWRMTISAYGIFAVITCAAIVSSLFFTPNILKIPILLSQVAILPLLHAKLNHLFFHYLSPRVLDFVEKASTKVSKQYIFDVNEKRKAVGLSVISIERWPDMYAPEESVMAMAHVVSESNAPISSRKMVRFSSAGSATSDQQAQKRGDPLVLPIGLWFAGQRNNSVGMRGCASAPNLSMISMPNPNQKEVSLESVPSEQHKTRYNTSQ